jgi:cytoskeleton protein RodZ
MSDDVDNQHDEHSDDEAAGPVCGERLAEARRTQQISVNEIAKELHLDEPKVRALERNEFEMLGAPVFAKGHLKKYAQLVNVDPDDVLTDYYQLNRSASAPPVISIRGKQRRELSPGPWIVVIVVIVIVATAYWWFTSRPVTVDPDTPATQQQEELPEEQDIAVDQPAADDDFAAADEPAPAVEEQTATDEPVTEGIEQIVEEIPQPEVAEGQLHLLLTFTGDCWTEITDASGRRLLFMLGKDGRTVELSGVEPFNVLFGNPSNVTLRVNGEDYALPPTNRPDRPMRLPRHTITERQ